MHARRSTRPCRWITTWAGVAFAVLVALPAPHPAHAGPAPAPSLPVEPVDIATTPGLSSAVTPTDSLLAPPTNRPTGLDPASYADTAPTSAAAAGPAGAALPVADTGPLAFDPATMMRQADLRPGMKGHGLSVFRGIRPQRFEAEVIGVRHNAMANMDIILCRLTGDEMKGIGVVAGMSGSPVFIGGKLIGAVGYGWPTNQEALAGVTPIANMLEVFNATPGRQPDDEGFGATFRAYETFMAIRRELALPAESPFRMSTRGATKSPGAAVPPAGAPTSNPSSAPPSEDMQPLSAPIYLSSASPATLALMRRMLPDLDFVTAPAFPAGPAAAGGYTAPSALAANSPGGPMLDLAALAAEFSGGYGIAIPMIEGDFNAAGVGTVTYRKGNRLVAFGHPMYGWGVTTFPMAPARINDIVRSNVRPFKVGEPLGQVGMVVQDREPAIGGVMGPGADMFPITMSVLDARYAQEPRKYSFRVWNHRQVGPTMAMGAMTEAIGNASTGGGDTAVFSKTTLTFDDGTTITKDNFFADPYGGAVAALAVGGDLGAMTNNPFRRVRVTAVDLATTLTGRAPQAAIMAASADRATYRPGDRVELEWTVQPFRRPMERMRHAIALPVEMPDGDYTLTLGDATSREGADAARDPGGQRVFDYDSLVALLKRNTPRNKVYVTLADRDTGANVRGALLPRLPDSVLATLEATTDPATFNPVRGNVLVDSEVVTPYDIQGAERIAIKVSRRGQ